MSQVAPCPGHWDYEGHPKRAQLLPQRIKALLIELRAGTYREASSQTDTRPVHKTIFAGLTPQYFPYFAGHYRGEPLRCLDTYEVEVPADPMVGVLAEDVATDVASLAGELTSGMEKADAIHADTTLNEDERVVEVVAIACDVFVRFLTIHPFANGNGHAARFLIWAFLGRYDLWADAWTIEPRPGHQHYSNGIYLHRRNSKSRLIAAVLASLAPKTP
ncbi:hypothetical protein BH11MYX2_BH11MYX2_35120 [soil metagenome]